MSTFTRKSGRWPTSWPRSTSPPAAIPMNPRREIVMICLPVQQVLDAGFLANGSRSAARPHIVTHQAQRLEHRGPIFQVRGADALDQFLGPLRNAQVELRRRDAEFIE